MVIKKILLLVLFSQLLMCSNHTSHANKYPRFNISLSIPKDVKFSEWRPTKNDIKKIYGQPDSIKNTPYGETYVYFNVNGCRYVIVDFHFDGSDYADDVFSMMFVGVNEVSSLGNTGKPISIKKIMHVRKTNPVEYVMESYGMPGITIFESAENLFNLEICWY